jgi:hypothetical protein
MLDLLTLIIFTIFLVHFYIFKYKEYQIWHKLREEEASVSEYNHIYTPSKNMPYDNELETAHIMNKNKIIEIINNSEEESWLNVYNEKNVRVYHFYCPKFLLFSDHYNGTHYLSAGEKYSFFYHHIKATCPITFRQVDYYKIRNEHSISLPSDILDYQNKHDFEPFFNNIRTKYTIKSIIPLVIKSSWPDNYFLAEGVLQANKRAFLLVSPKPGTQNIELLNEEESYYLPINENKTLSVLLETDKTSLSIIERCQQISALKISVNLFFSSVIVVIDNFS